MGYSLNQRGLFAGVVRSLEDRTVKTNAGELYLNYTYCSGCCVFPLRLSIEGELARGDSLTCDWHLIICGCTAKKEGDPSVGRICTSCCVIERRRIPGSQRSQRLTSPRAPMTEPVFFFKYLNELRCYAPSLLASPRLWVKDLPFREGFLVFVLGCVCVSRQLGYP